MKVLVLGAGVIGVSTAYFLATAGHQVIVVDRQPGPGLETSFANGGQLSASHAEPWANPAAPANLLHWLGKRDAPLVFHLRADPSLWAFGVRFLANCGPRVSIANMRAILRLAIFNRRSLANVTAATDLQFDFKKDGILHFFRTEKGFDHAVRLTEVLNEGGCRSEVLDAAGCVAIEPALAATRDNLAGGIYSRDDSSGDAYEFTKGLAAVCAAAGVEFRYSETVLRLAVDRGKFHGAEVSGGPIEADSCVVALASYSRALLAPIGIRVPVYPAKGYSVTLDVGGRAQAPAIGLTDDAHKLVYSRLGDRLRIAGTAEFNGYNPQLDERRTQSVLAAVMHDFPGCGDPGEAKFWAGLRPLTADGKPVIGATRIDGLYLNTGHGTLGWTTCCASGQIISELVSGRAPGIALAEFAIERFH